MFELVMDWLRTEPTSVEEYIVLSGFIFVFGTIFAAIGFYQLGKLAAGKMLERSLSVKENGLLGGAYKLWGFIVGEDAIYRFFLTGTAALMIQDNHWAVIACIVPISIVFGFAPPHTFLPVKTRVAVALGGFILSLLYLKCGGWNGYSPRAFLITVLAHTWVTGILAGAWYFSREKD